MSRKRFGRKQPKSARETDELPLPSVSRRQTRRTVLEPNHTRLSSPDVPVGRPARVVYAGAQQKDNVVFGVEVKTTKPGEVSGITDWGTWTNAQKDWYYQGTAANPECWNFWYIYTIDYKEGPCYWIDFTDIRSSYAAANQSPDVGLYFRIEFFGDGTGDGATGQFGGHSLPS